MTHAATIDALTDHEAIRVLAVVIDHQAPLPDPTRLRELQAALSHAADNPDLQPHRQGKIPPPTEGDLARTTLAYLAATCPELAPMIDHAVRLAENTTRFEPATLAVGGLVLIALQTEITIDRNTAGQWQFRLHKKAMRDSTLGQLIGKLLTLYSNTPQP